MLKFFVSVLIFSSFALSLAVAQGSSAAPQKPSATSAQSSDNKAKAGLANPASVNCEKKGGTLEVRKGKKGEYGVCKFPNGKECEEWALLRGKCSPDVNPGKSPSTSTEKPGTE